MQQEQSNNDKEIKTDERLYLIEHSLRNAVVKDDMMKELKKKASNERIVELRDSIHKLQLMSVQHQEKQD